MIVRRKRNPIGNLKLTFPRVYAQNSVADYFLSKISAKQARYTTNWEICRDCSSVALIDARTTLKQSEESLAASRRRAIEQRIHYDEKWSDLADKHAAFSEMFRKFNKFVRENQEKRERAERKIADEIELQERRTSDIEKMEEDHTSIVYVKNLMEKKIKDHKMYEDYLQSVVRISSAIKNISELLFRYESLLETRGLLSQKQHLNLNALECAQSNMMKLVEDKVLTLVGLQNQLANLQERYDLAYAKSLQWESTVSAIQDICTREMANVLKVRHCINDTYATMCLRQNIPGTLDDDDYEAKLNVIKKSFTTLSNILSSIKTQTSSKFRQDRSFW